MAQIEIYSAEKEAKLDDLIRSSASIAFAAELKNTDKFVLTDGAIKKLDNYGYSKAATGDFDLHYLKTLLVSTGQNKNDDVFDIVETWKARCTPEDKPFNYEHDCAQIIGHITGNYVVNEDGKVIADNTTADALPAKFHIIANAVIYKHWPKADLQEKIDKVLAEITKGEWYVSMECLFAGFDYAVKDKESKASIVARNEKTAFLTKHLRAYGGTGKYNDLTVARVLKNIVFSGKGLVKKPANPESIIFGETETVSISQAKILHSVEEMGYSITSGNSETKKGCDITMATELEIKDKQIASLESEVDKLKTALRDNDVKQVTASKEKAEATANELSAKLKSETEATVALKKEVDALKVSLEEKEKTYKAIAEELGKIHAERKEQARVKTVMAKLKIDEAKASSHVKKLSGLSDEQFEATVTAMEESMMTMAPATNNPALPAVDSKIPAPLPGKQTPAQDPPKVSSLPGGGQSMGTEKDPAAVNANAAVLDSAKPNADAALSTTASNNGVEKVRNDVASFFGCKTQE